jgi:hypothetical protein
MSSPPAGFLGPCLLGLLLFASGCSHSAGEARLLPVTGRVTVAGNPLTTGTVSFLPDTSRGNTSGVAPGGEIQPDGSYTLFSAGRKGAPAGFYRVIVSAAEPVDPNNPLAPRRSFVNVRYNSVETSNLQVEVTETPVPGAYDLPLKP